MQLIRRFYRDAFKLPNRSNQTAKYSTHKMGFLICQLKGKLNGEIIFSLSNNICNYLK